MSKIEITNHANINYEANKKLGYYLLGDKIYYNKFHALVDEAKQSEHEVKWFFNEDKLFRVNWTVEPDADIRELYRQRAQQLRDTYDYIRLECSGGSDSATVAYAFLLNGIHLDEVVFRYPKAGEKGLVGNAFDLSCENTLSEWEFAAKPLLDWISTKHPTTKITIHDYTEDMLADEDTRDESWIFKTRHFLQPGHYAKHKLTDAHKKLNDQGSKVCVLFGIDKPKVCIKDDKFWLYFTDQPTGENDPDLGGYTNMTNEYFFWSPDLPELLVKQAHIIKNWFMMPQNHKMQSLLRWPNGNFATRTIYEQAIKSIIYPDYDSNTFQVVKSTNNIHNEMDYWFHTNFKDTQSHRIWEAGINYLLDNVNDRHIGYRQNRAMDLTVFQSPFYYIGECYIPVVSPVVATKAQKDTVYKHLINNQLVIY